MLSIWSLNNPCRIPGENIQRHFEDIPKIGSRFPKASIGIRGVVGFTFRSGFIKRGDDVQIVLP